MIYGYIRVSTDAQDCENQKIGINELAAKLGLRIEKWIEDQGVSGMKDPKKRNLGKLMKLLKPDDHILVSEISRLSRELFTIFEILKFCTEKGIKLNTVKDNYVLDGSITSKVLAFAFGMAANIERDMIVKRTREGLEARRRAGVVLGRPIGSKSVHKKLDKHEADIKKYLQLGLSYSAIAKILKVHRLTVARICKENQWEDFKTSHRSKKQKEQLHVHNAAKIKDLKLTLEDILSEYRETKSLEKMAELHKVSTTTLRTYIVRNGWLDKLVELDETLRLEIPSIGQTAKVYEKNKRI